MTEKGESVRQETAEAACRIEKDPRLADHPDFYNCISDLLAHPAVQSMKQYPQHGNTSCFDHCLSVSYYNYRLCKRLGLDARSAARAGMLHDLFLYDWHTRCEMTGKRFHGFTHPGTALKNACRYFDLSPREQDMISRHMWPLTIKPPRYRETWVICLTDKYSVIREIVEYRREQFRPLFHRAVTR